MMTGSWARDVAQRLLAEALPRRWAHVQGVGGKAEHVAASLALKGETLVAAAWLHDVGYAPDVVDTGFHPLDGARYLAVLGIPERVVNLVARHSYAILEAALRGVAPWLTAFPDEGGVLRDALWYCDLTTSPDGKSVSVEERITEIKARYGPGDIVTRFITEGEPELLAAVERTERRLAKEKRLYPVRQRLPRCPAWMRGPATSEGLSPQPEPRPAVTWRLSRASAARPLTDVRACYGRPARAFANQSSAASPSFFVTSPTGRLCRIALRSPASCVKRICRRSLEPNIASQSGQHSLHHHDVLQLAEVAECEQLTLVAVDRAGVSQRSSSCRAVMWSRTPRGSRARSSTRSLISARSFTSTFSIRSSRAMRCGSRGRAPLR